MHLQWYDTASFKRVPLRVVSSFMNRLAVPATFFLAHPMKLRFIYHNDELFYKHEKLAEGVIDGNSMYLCVNETTVPADFCSRPAWLGGEQNRTIVFFSPQKSRRCEIAISQKFMKSASGEVPLIDPSDMSALLGEAVGATDNFLNVFSRSKQLSPKARLKIIDRAPAHEVQK